MDLEFKQRRFFHKARVKITEKGVEVEASSLNNSATVFMAFEEVGFDVSRFTKSNRFWLIATLFCVFGLAAVMISDFSEKGYDLVSNLLFYALAVVVCLAGFIITYSRTYVIRNFEDKPGIGFLTDPARDPALKQFLEELKKSRDSYLIEKYGQVNRNTPYETVRNNLKWLKNTDALTEEELEIKLSELEKLNTGSRIVGFGNREN